ncbi:SAM-dependent methyltransferase [Streptomyces sp. CFMR 7]|uniref:SAM-dependent methyltransferase n=1 Tax=Streptomyces sp. CFMR 7 TaxID=1649184 RepID=UPI0016425AE4|nr:SAM-dependent methyltransferase [Streptomyces sp. CFMR 7]
MTSTSLVATGMPGGPPAAVARVWDYLTGGTDNYQQDHDLGDRLAGAAPWLPQAVLAHRRHTTRAVKYPAAQGFSQILDLGCGLPYEDRGAEVLHLHDAARTVRDGIRTLYVAPFGPARVGADTLPAEGTRTLAVRADARARSLPPGSALPITHPTDDLGQMMSKLTPPAKKQASTSRGVPGGTSKRCSAAGPCCRPAWCPPAPGHLATNAPKPRETAAVRSDPPAEGTHRQMSSMSLVPPSSPIPGDRPPHVSRVADYFTGGRDNAPADRELAGRLRAAAPWLPQSVRAHRAHTTRVVRHLASEGFHQYLDLGCGLPYADQGDEALHPHDAARSILVDVHGAQADVRTVYVDNYPLACGHANMILAEERGTGAVNADARNVADLLALPTVASKLDLERPVAVLAHDLLPWMDDHDAVDLLNDLSRLLPPGSALSLTHTASDLPPGPGSEERDSIRMMSALYAEVGIAFHPRSAGHLRALLNRWSVQEPGVVRTELWGSGYGPFAQRPLAGPADFTGAYAAVALTTTP